jgi:HK97 family phage major capsid protein
MEIEVKTLIDKVSDEIKAMKLANEELTKALTLKASPEDIKSLETALKAKDAEFEAKMVKAIEALDKIQLEMKDNTQFNNNGKSDFAEMKKKWDDKSFIETLQKRGNKEGHTFEVKTGTAMDVATYLSGSGGLATAVVVPFREPGIGKAPDRVPTLLDLISRGNINSDPLTWVERSARTMAAAAVAEGAAYANTILTYIQRSQAVERLGHFIKVQNKALEDWDLLMSEINLELFTGLERIIEEEVYSGSGTTPHLQGITDTGHAAAYSSTGLTGTVITPNHFDAIRAAIMQIRQNEYQASAAFINPADGAAMDMPKNADGLYLLPPFIMNNGTVVKGVPVIESNLVTTGDLLIGDFKKDALFMKRGIEVRIWEQNEDDVLFDRKTITASVRCVNRLKVPDYNAFVYDTFADIITAITV